MGLPPPLGGFQHLSISSVLLLLPPSTTARSPNPFPNGLYQEGAGQRGSGAMMEGGPAGICPWSAPACLEPPMLRLFLLSPSCCVLQAKPPQPHSRARCSPGSPRTDREPGLALRGSPAREREEDDLGANLELHFLSLFRHRGYWQAVLQPLPASAAPQCPSLGKGSSGEKITHKKQGTCDGELG